MEKIQRNVRDLDSNQRRLYEDMIGHKLAENQQVIIQVITVDAAEQHDNGTGGQAAGSLPDWCNVFDGLSEQEIAEVESVALQRSDMTRPSE